MPLYEYEPEDRECLICEGRVCVLQGVGEEPLKLCPTCGLEVRRVISKASVKIARPAGAERAGQKGFTTFRRSEKGVWERTGGEGPDYLVGSPEDVAAVEAEKAPPPPVHDLDA